MLKRFRQYQFLFEELVKRDFTKKYKRTILGMAWSILSPLMNLLIMWLVFGRLLGSNVEHYVIYLFSGSLPAADAARGVSVIRRDENDFRNVCEVPFMIPLDYERDAVTVRVDAHKNNQTVSWEERLLLSVEGTVLDELYTALH